MNDMEDRLYHSRDRKRRLKRKKNLGIKAYIGSIIFLLVGVICFVFGAYITGWDIWSWFISGQAYLVYAIATLLILAIGYLVYLKRVKHDDE